MRAVVQRVSSSRVLVAEEVVAAIGRGLLLFVGVEANDTEADARYVAGKVAGLRVFEDPGEASSPRRLNKSVTDLDAEVLVVSQFTLFGDCRRGRRPSFDRAAEPGHARALYECVIRELEKSGVRVESGRFRAMMRVELVNDGPVTLLLDSRKTF